MPDVAALLTPKSVVVIGASEDHSSVRGHCCETILRHPFGGSLHFVTRSGGTVFGRPTVQSLDAVDGTPDLAVILAPAAHCAEVLEDCGRRGIGAAIVVASGFAEDGTEDGRALQHQLAEIARTHDIALSGPNGEGFADYVSGLAATFSPVLRDAEPMQPGRLAAGNVTVIAQSGAIGFGLADLALARGIPLDRVITTGNEAGLTLVDYLDYLVSEGRTKSVLAFVEGFRDGAGFLAVAHRARARGIGLTVLRVGKSETGMKQAASHTGALAGDDRLIRDLLRQEGVADAADPVEAVECAALLAGVSGRTMAGRNIGICSSTGGGAGLLADACELAGLMIPPLGAETRAALDAVLPSYASTVNPVDATAGGIRALGYTRLARIVADDPAIDAVIVAASGRTVATLGKEADALKTLAAEVQKPVLFWSYTTPGAPFLKLIDAAGLPVAVSPRAVATALAAHCGPNGSAEAIAASAPVCAEGVMTEARAYPLLEAQGLSAGRWKLCATPAEARAFAATLDRPAAIKIQSATILHKSEAGGVALNVTSDAAEAAGEAILKAAAAHAPDAQIDGLLVQEMAPSGVEIIIGGFRDASFGPVVMVGLGGIFTEVMGDVVFATAPVAEDTASGMLTRLKGQKLLDGVRGRPAADKGALARAVSAVSRLIASPDIREIDLNPVFVHEQGLTVADALIVAEDCP